MPYALTTVITCLSLMLYFWTAFSVGKARGKYGISAPATTGNVDFERIFRVQQNTLENLIMYVPGLWLFSCYVSVTWGAALGVVWIVGRFIYARSYYLEAGKRGTGFIISIGVIGVLLLGALIGAVLQLLHS